MRRRDLRLKRVDAGAATLVTTGVLGLVLALGLAAHARAQSCASADIRFTLPADGATRVPVDSTLRAYYGVGARYAAESVFLASGARRETLVGDFDSTTGVLSVMRSTSLEPSTAYTVDWPSLASTGLPARGSTVSFTTGDATDDAPPAIDAIASLAWDVVAIDDPCLGTSAERYTFDLVGAGARDDGGVALLEASVYMTRGPLLEASAPPRLVATDSLGAGTRAVRAALPREDALGEVCFAMLVRDLRGRSSAATPERCVVTERPPFFRPCSVTAAGAAPTLARGPSAPLALFGFAVLVALGRRRLPSSRRH